MHVPSFLFLGLLLLPFAELAHAAEVQELCQIRIESEEKIGFSATETKWLCGDPESEAWKEIPLNQKRGWLRSFLQNRGYHSYSFREENGTLFVNVGPRSRVERFTVEGAPKEWNWAKRRKVIGSVLDPGVISENSNWAKRELQYRGYPCATAEGRAFLDRKEVLLQVNPGPKQVFGTVQSQGDSDMDPAILERFTAFEAGQDFDIRLLELTSDRILREDLYLSTYYDVICDDQLKARIVRRFVPALPRLLTFGIGADTERGPIARARWKRTRLTRKGDSLESTAFLSLREQRIEAKYRNHFPEDLSSRLEFAPLLAVNRQDEKQYETISYQVEPALEYGWAHQTSQTTVRFGPQFKHTEVRRGEGPRQLNALRIAANFGFMSHLFEFYSNDPRQGYNFGLEAWTQIRGLVAKNTIHKVLVRQEMLWNLGNFEPPLFVFGWRGYQGSYFFHRGETLQEDLTVAERFFLGGDDDIRGFGRKSLPRNQRGYLTVFYQGLELRVVEVLPFSLQPFVFFDAAKAGYSAGEVGTPLYYAPGVGMRWASPVGTLRASLARGFASQERADDPVPKLQFFVSFGKEF